MGSQQTSPNTERLMAIAKMPIFIILISIVGLFLEEFVFRKVFFGELYNAIKANRVVSFLIASIVSSLVFALAHNDMRIYSYVFWYGHDLFTCLCFTKKLLFNWYSYVTKWYSRFNASFGGEALKAQEHANFILHFILN